MAGPDTVPEVSDSELDELQLGRDQCLLVLGKLCASDGGQLMHGIECQSFCSCIITEYEHFFSASEVEKLRREGEWKTYEDVIGQAMKRDPKGVLSAVYKALIYTKSSGGATQHIEIARKMLSIASNIKIRDDSTLPHGTMESGMPQDEADSPLSKAMPSSFSTEVTPSSKTKQECDDGSGAHNSLTSWALNSMKAKLQVISAISHDGRIYASGIGADDTPGSRHIQEYCLDLKEWTILPEAPNHNAPMTVINGYVTLVGGRDKKTNKLTDSLCFWNGYTRQWLKMQLSLPLPRVACAVLHCENLLLVSGGAVNDTKFEDMTKKEKYTVVNTVNVYNFSTKQWSTPKAVELPQPLRSHYMVRYGEYIYLLAGALTFPARVEDGDKHFNHQAWRARWSEVLLAGAQPSQNVWRPIEGPPARRPTIASCRNSFISVGGTKDGVPQNAIYECIVDGTDSCPHCSWKKVGYMSEGRYRHAAVFVGNRGAALLVAGGYVSSKLSEDEANVKTSTAELVVL